MPLLLETQGNKLMGKQVIVTKLFEFGGSNTHLKSTIKYFGSKQVILLLDDETQLDYLPKIADREMVQAEVMKGLHPYAHLAHASTLSNIREVIKVCVSVIRMLLFCLRNKVSGITVNTVDPEKYLYFFWVPFIRVSYLVHSTPEPRFTPFTTYTCNRLLGKKKRLITVSRANKTAICKAWDIDKKKEPFVAVIYNCVDKAPAGWQANTESPVTKDILTMGHLVAYKNPDTWLKTAKALTRQFADVRFIWLGNGELLNQLKKQTEADENILLPGLISDPAGYLERAAIYYQPSLHETHGIAVLEAMSYRLPCVVSDTGGMPESIDHDFNGILVPPEDVDRHVAALERLITNPQLRRDYGRNGYQKYREQFSFEKFSAEMDKIYLD